jgi:hypothetical protein
MNKYIGTVAALFVASALGGCEVPARSTTMSLGAVKYDEAFQAARNVMSQYFSVTSADSGTGVIESRPKPIDAPPEGIFRTLAARQVARMSLRRSGQEVLADMTVEVQRQGSPVHSQLQTAGTGYDSVPNKTPAETDAATTAEQNEAWQTEKYDRTLEQTMLRQLYGALHGGK